MHAALPSSLDSAALSRRLGELAGHEREVQVDFLLYLDEFDRRRAWLEAGYGSLWDYCLEVLHLREGAAGRRIAAMRVLRRFPRLSNPLRDGRLCLSNVALLGPVLTEENAENLLARAAFRTKAEVEHLVVSLAPREAARGGLRKLPASLEGQSAAVLPLTLRPAEPELPDSNAGTASQPATAEPHPAALAVAVPAAPVRAPEARPTMRPVAADTFSLRVTVDAEFKQDLERLTELLSHKVPRGDLGAVLREALRCAIEKHGKRKGAVEPARKRSAAAPSATGGGKPGELRSAIPAEVRRQVWKRDGGQCTWRGPDGHRCTSRWKLEVDHIDPAARGGAATVDRLRLLCRAHNDLYAEQTYGKAHMARFRRAARLRTGGFAISSDSEGAPPL
jgi:hypothetical protein